MSALFLTKVGGFGTQVLVRTEESVWARAQGGFSKDDGL